MKASHSTGAERQAALLQASARVSRSIASILDLNLLFNRTVDIICDEFGFYYAGVFVVDESGEWAVLKAGRGEAGRAMLAERHKLHIGGNSMIGAAIENRSGRIALDVGKEAVFFRNPFLPKTRSEMALPLIAGDEVIGALTVQSEIEAALAMTTSPPCKPWLTNWASPLPMPNSTARTRICCARPSAAPVCCRLPTRLARKSLPF